MSAPGAGRSALAQRRAPYREGCGRVRAVRRVARNGTSFACSASGEPRMRTRTLSIAGMAVMGFITAALAIEEHAPAKDRTKVVQPQEQVGRVAIRVCAVSREGPVTGALLDTAWAAV